METDENRATYMTYLRKVRDKGHTLPGFEESVTIVSNEARSKGLENEDIALIISVLKGAELGIPKSSSLIKCMIPKYRIPNTLLKDIILWYITLSETSQITLSTLVLQWIIGVLEYDLVDRTTVNIFYEIFFSDLMKRQKLESHLARIIYELTEPEDVTRSQVIRLQSLQKYYKKPQKHIVALLSLFKSYKPELVPEKIPSIGIGSVWRPLPNELLCGFEDAKLRASLQETTQKTNEHFKWCTTGVSSKGKMKETVLPSVEYFHIGSSIFKEKNTTSIFDVCNLKSLGKYHTNVELPCNATSLLTNTAGYHLLMFANFEYQNRFSYNLYNTLRRAFLLEPGKYPKEELDRLLDMTYEFLQYIQHGIPIVTRFLDEYLSCRTGEHQTKLLAIAQWTPLSITVTELEECVMKHMRLMFFESSLQDRCEIIRTLRMMLLNLCVNSHVENNFKSSESAFLGQKCTINLEEVLPAITKFAESLIVSGFNNHSNSSLFISEALLFYEQIFITESQYRMNSWTFAPSAIIYGGVVSKSCLILSRVCSLLINYRERSKYFLKLNLQDHFSKQLNSMEVYANDLTTVLWHGQSFSSRRRIEGKFLKTLSDKGIQDLSVNMLDQMLRLDHHYAILPYKNVLVKVGLKLQSKEDMFKVAVQYFPEVSEFLRIMVGIETEEEEVEEEEEEEEEL